MTLIEGEKLARQHRDENPGKFLLKYNGRIEKDVLNAAVINLEAKQKHARKFYGILELAPDFIFPTKLVAEQATSVDLAKIHTCLLRKFVNERGMGSDVAPLSVLDITAGLGIDDFIMAMEGCKVTAIDILPVLAEALKINSQRLGISDKIKVICGDSIDYIRNSAHFDTYTAIFADPARRDVEGRKVCALRDCLPDIPGLLRDMRHLAKVLMVKMSPMFDCLEAARETDAQTVAAIGTARECKEVVTLTDFKETPEIEDIVIQAITTRNSHVNSIWSYTRREESVAKAEYGLGKAGAFIFIPYPTVMKAGGYNLISQRFELQKAAAHTRALKK